MFLSHFSLPLLLSLVAGIPLPGWLTDKILTAAIPIVIGPLVFLTVQLFKALSAAIDSAPAWAKQAIVLLISAVFTWLASHLGAEFCPPDVTCTLSNVDVHALLAALLAFAIHAGRKAQQLRE